MDAMAAGGNRPQEDEFALMLLGLPSPYERIAFPERPNAGDRALDLRAFLPGERRVWKRTYFRLVQALTLANCGRRLILKCPPNTARISTLLELFPDARFVHVVRDPYEVYSSTLNLWRTLFAAHGLQQATWAGLQEHVLSTFTRLHQAFEEMRGLVPPGRLHEVRYEQLIRSPIAQLEVAYRELELDEFERVRQNVELHLAEFQDYEPRSHSLTADERSAINDRWKQFFQRYGYPMQLG